MVLVWCGRPAVWLLLRGVGAARVARAARVSAFNPLLICWVALCFSLCFSFQCRGRLPGVCLRLGFVCLCFRC